jgi:hypothetical protein
MKWQNKNNNGAAVCFTEFVVDGAAKDSTSEASAMAGRGDWMERCMNRWKSQ